MKATGVAMKLMSVQTLRDRASLRPPALRHDPPRFILLWAALGETLA